MTVRSVVISFFIICISFGMTITNGVNDTWNGTYNQTLMGPNISPFMNYSNTGVPSDEAGYNSSISGLTDYQPPGNVIMGFDFFQGIKYAGVLIGILFNTVFGFFYYLAALNIIPNIWAIPLTIMLVFNHILAVMYIVTGRTFIY